MADKPFHNPFGALAHLRPNTNSEPSKELPPPEPPIKPEPRAATVPRAVVRLERKGRGGKDVTVLEQIDLTPTVRQRWLKELKAALGCGGSIEGDAIVLQGDHRKRLPELLTKMGVRKISGSIS